MSAVCKKLWNKYLQAPPAESHSCNIKVKNIGFAGYGGFDQWVVVKTINIFLT